MAIWGGAAVAGKIAVADLPALTVAALRTVLAGVVALPLALALRVPLPRGGERIWLLLLSAACAFILFPVAFSIGIAHTSATHAAMILALAPLLTGAIAHAWDRQLPPARWWLGGAIALAGEALLVLGRGHADAAPGKHPALGDALVVLAAVTGALGYVAGGRLNRLGYTAQGVTYWGVVLSTLALLPVLPWMLPDGAWSSGTFWALATPRSLASLAYLALGVTILGYVLWTWALGHGGIARIGMLQFAQPVVSVLLAAALLDEPIGPVVVVAGTTILLGVSIAARR